MNDNDFKINQNYKKNYLVNDCFYNILKIFSRGEKAVSEELWKELINLYDFSYKQGYSDSAIKIQKCKDTIKSLEWPL